MPPFDNAMDTVLSLDFTSEIKDHTSRKSTILRSPLKTKRLEPTRSVSFHTAVKVQNIISLEDFTDDEIYDSWYTDDEILGIKREMKSIAKKMSVGVIPPESDRITTRGLECRTKRGAQRRTENKRKSRQVVIDEQDSQWEAGVNDASYIAMLYCSTAHRSRAEAAALGLADEAAAREIMQC